MTMTATPIFGQTPKLATCVATGALTDLDDAPGSELQVLLTAGANGAAIYGAWGVPRATATATVLYLFVSTDGGSTKRMVDAALAAADTLSTTDPPARVAFGAYSETTPLRVPAGAIVYFGASVALSAGWVGCAAYLDF